MIRKKQSQIISYLRKNKLIFLLSFFFLALISSGTQAAMVDLTYKPNVPIPIEVGGIDFGGTNTISDGTFLAKYIVAIYTFGAGFAGIVAMLMLVIAGWKWLMAGGNAQKIIEAKGTITGALLGLAILFGGQLLLRQISENFASIQSLDIRALDKKEGEEDTFEADCAGVVATSYCGVMVPDSSSTSSDIARYCVGHRCSPINKACVYVDGNEGGFTVGDICIRDFDSNYEGLDTEIAKDRVNSGGYLVDYFKCGCR